MTPPWSECNSIKKTVMLYLKECLLPNLAEARSLHSMNVIPFESDLMSILSINQSYLTNKKNWCLIGIPMNQNSKKSKYECMSSLSGLSKEFHNIIFFHFFHKLLRSHWLPNVHLLLVHIFSTNFNYFNPNHTWTSSDSLMLSNKWDFALTSLYHYAVIDINYNIIHQSKPKISWNSSVQSWRNIDHKTSIYEL